MTLRERCRPSRPPARTCCAAPRPRLARSSATEILVPLHDRHLNLRQADQDHPRGGTSPSHDDQPSSAPTCRPRRSFNMGCRAAPPARIQDQGRAQEAHSGDARNLRALPEGRDLSGRRSSEESPRPSSSSAGNTPSFAGRRLTELADAPAEIEHAGRGFLEDATDHGRLFRESLRPRN